MDLWFVAFVGGLVGSIFMDVIEEIMSKVGIQSGVKATHIGRWAHGLSKGKFYYSDIDKVAPVNNELKIAFVFHYLVGGGLVALGYPVLLYFYNIFSLSLPIPLAVVYGLLTCVFPWFILMPSIGKGMAGNQMPAQAMPIIAPVISHLAYGLGLWLTLFVYSWAIV